jgi:TRAP-type mannitol/chloroaromatic compound transport system permease small subunit
VPVILLLFLQVPLRLLPVGRWSTMSNDIGQLFHAVLFMTASAYALRWDQHARVDVFFRALPSRTKAWINLAGSLAFALPWLAVLGVYSTPIVISSWLEQEVFVDSWAPGYFILKSMLLVFALTMGLATLAQAARALVTLIRPEGEGSSR